MDTCDEGELQGTMCDRSVNPTLQDVSRLYSQWRLTEYGSDRNGKELAESLIEEISLYNTANATSGGKAHVQVYETENTDQMDSDTESQPPKPKKKKICYSTPLIITACTPLMSRVHKNIQQAREMIFCDSTSCLEKYNCSLFVFSTSSPCGGRPLGVAITSDEKERTIKKALQLLLKVLPEGSFYGSKNGPKVVMTDDSNTEKAAISQTWPNAHLLLCVFHFLQSNWTWLHEGKNKIKNEHRAILIGKVKELVYSKTETNLIDAYSAFFKNDIVAMYPHFQSHIKSHWLRRLQWAICYRSNIITRGNNTNNISEAGIKIVRELVFGRIKAYNLIQMFQFVTEGFETYMKRKLLSIAHNRFNNFISTKYKGLLADKIDKSSITVLNYTNKMFLVNSSRDSKVTYRVDMEIGTCSCDIDKNGTPCSHQAAV